MTGSDQSGRASDNARCASPRSVGCSNSAPKRGRVIIYLTPSCHFPLGKVMRIDQRMRVLDIARQRGAWIIEDDFDSE